MALASLGCLRFSSVPRGSSIFSAFSGTGNISPVVGPSDMHHGIPHPPPHSFAPGWCLPSQLRRFAFSIADKTYDIGYPTSRMTFHDMVADCAGNAARRKPHAIQLCSIVGVRICLVGASNKAEGRGGERTREKKERKKGRKKERKKENSLKDSMVVGCTTLHYCVGCLHHDTSVRYPTDGYLFFHLPPPPLPHCENYGAEWMLERSSCGLMGERCLRLRRSSCSM